MENWDLALDIFEASRKRACPLSQELRQKSEPNIVSYGAIITACEKGAQWEIALKLLKEPSFCRDL